MIGGGSAGLHFASLQQSTVIEEHDSVGMPVACTGLVTEEILKFFTKAEINKIKNKSINNTRIIVGEKQLDIEIGNDYVLCNQSFIKLIEKKAIDNNSSILTNSHFLDNSHNKARIINNKTNKEKIIYFDKLIGADGPHSKVAKLNNLATNKKYVTGVQVIRKHQMDESIHFYPNNSEYAWAVPESKNTIRLGLCTRNYTARKEFDDFQLKYPGTDTANISGVIPLHRPGLKTKKGNIIVIGDAAAQTKNTTGGGIIAGIKSAESIAGNYSLAKLNRELYLHYLANNILKKYSETEWNRLLTKINTEDVKKILKEENRDNFVRLAIKLFSRKPSVALAALPLIR